VDGGVRGARIREFPRYAAPLDFVARAYNLDWETTTCPLAG